MSASTERSEDGPLPTTAGTIARLASARAREAGLDLEPLLKEARISQADIENPDVRLSAGAQIQFLNLVADALADDFLGFHLARGQDLREFGFYYYVMASAQTLIEALQLGARYGTTINEAITQHCSVRENIEITLNYIGVNRHSDRHQIEFALTSLVRLCRKLTGVKVLPLRVRLIHFRTYATDDFSEFFGDTVEFGASCDDIALPANVGKLPVVGADPYLNRLLVGYFENYLINRHQGRGSFQSRVENAVVPLLSRGTVNTEEVARKLGVGQRTLARRLSSEGLTFSDLIAKLRYDLAKRYLADGALSISQIAWLLGYQEVSSFSHAFKRWSGETPRKMRGQGA